jgi:hypothetical protein
VYIGVDHVFSPNLSTAAKGGASYVDLYNDPVSTQQSWSPYADMSITYTYIPGCYVQAGFRQDINATSEAAVGSNGQLTQYQETSTVYLDCTHRFTPKLAGTVITQYTYSSFKDGAYENDGENNLSVGLNLSYQINRHFWADAGYNFDELFSNAGSRSNTHNVVYLGVGASY